MKGIKSGRGDMTKRNLKGEKTLSLSLSLPLNCARAKMSSTYQPSKVRQFNCWPPGILVV